MVIGPKHLERDLGGDEVPGPDEADQEEEPVGLALVELAFRRGTGLPYQRLALVGSRIRRARRLGGGRQSAEAPPCDSRGPRGGADTAPTSSSSSPSSSPSILTSFPSAARVRRARRVLWPDARGGSDRPVKEKMQPAAGESAPAPYRLWIRSEARRRVAASRAAAPALTPPEAGCYGVVLLTDASARST